MSGRVLVTGSRVWTDRDVIRDALGEAVESLGQHPLVVHGAAAGADTLAAEVARMVLRLHCEPWPADWLLYGRGAGPKRNAEMIARGADLCLAFPIGSSPGTWDCIRRAVAAGIPVRIYPPRSTQ